MRIWRLLVTAERTARDWLQDPAGCATIGLGAVLCYMICLAISRMLGA